MSDTHYFRTAVEGFGVSMELKSGGITVATWEARNSRDRDLGAVRSIRRFTGKKRWWLAPSSIRLHREIQEFIHDEMQEFSAGIAPVLLEVARDIETQFGLKPETHGAGSFHARVAIQGGE